MKNKQRNIPGYLSFVAVVISIVFFFLPINIELNAGIIALISLWGIGFSIASKKLGVIFAGIILNIMMLGIAYLLLIGRGFSSL